MRRHPFQTVFVDTHVSEWAQTDLRGPQTTQDWSRAVTDTTPAMQAAEQRLRETLMQRRALREQSK